MRRLRKLTTAWDIDFWEQDGIRSIAVLGTEKEIMQWGRDRAKIKGIKRWASRPFPEFNDRYEGSFRIAGCPSWVLVSPIRTSLNEA